MLRLVQHARVGLAPQAARGGDLTLELFGGLETIDTPPVGLTTPVALPFRAP